MLIIIALLIGFSLAMMPGMRDLSAVSRPDEKVIEKTIPAGKSEDFKITGEGGAGNWSRVDWITIPQRTAYERPLLTKVKILWSETGIYFLFSCQDTKLTADMNSDFLDLWKEDVVEVFLWPDEKTTTYFEYELSPLNFELPILISNNTGDLVRWMPFHYDADRKTKHATQVVGGEKKSNGSVSGWTAEFYIPYKLLRPLNNILPEPGTKWRINLYRVDYDKDTVEWAWQNTDKSFHEYDKFGTLVFK